MLKRILFVTFILAVGCLWAQEKQQQKKDQAPAASETSTAATAPAATVPHNFTITPEDTARKNPVKFTEAAVARGKKIYTTQCALCHGDKGDGKTDLTKEMNISPPDFTNPDTLNKRTDGDLFAIISSGLEPMPGQHGRMSEKQRWYLVDYLRSLEGKTPAKGGNEPEENVILVPQ
jgi:mono/diheme cytochrome c family protein